MTDERLDATVSDAVAGRVRELRKARGWQTGDLAARCGELGDSQITENVIENIESGRRRDGQRTRAVTVDELYILARALDVPVFELLLGGTPEQLEEALAPVRAIAEIGPQLLHHLEQLPRVRAEVEHALEDIQKREEALRKREEEGG